jgi:hypothetical protein
MFPGRDPCTIWPGSVAGSEGFGPEGPEGLAAPYIPAHRQHARSLLRQGVVGQRLGGTTEVRTSPCAQVVHALCQQTKTGVTGFYKERKS